MLEGGADVEALAVGNAGPLAVGGIGGEAEAAHGHVQDAAFVGEEIDQGMDGDVQAGFFVVPFALDGAEGP